jgi:hypothetical protein
LQPFYDFPTQTIHIEAPRETFTITSGKEKSSAEIIKQMQDPVYELENVNGEFRKFIPTPGLVGVNARKNCDGCHVVHNEHAFVDFFDSRCVQFGSFRVCLPCKILGRLCCS